MKRITVMQRHLKKVKENCRHIHRLAKHYYELFDHCRQLDSELARQVREHRRRKSGR